MDKLVFLFIYFLVFFICLGFSGLNLLHSPMWKLQLELSRLWQIRGARQFNVTNASSERSICNKPITQMRNTEHMTRICLFRRWWGASMRKTFSRRSLILWKLTLWMRNLLSCNLVSLQFILSESERGYNSRIKSVYGEGGFLIWNLSWEEQREQKEVLHFKKSGRESERWETTCWREAETSLETDHTGFRAHCCQGKTH